MQFEHDLIGIFLRFLSLKRHHQHWTEIHLQIAASMRTGLRNLDGSRAIISCLAQGHFLIFILVLITTGLFLLTKHLAIISRMDVKHVLGVITPDSLLQFVRRSWDEQSELEGLHDTGTAV
jgi:hypothetical protein